MEGFTLEDEALTVDDAGAVVKAVQRLRVAHDAVFFRGHFPGAPVVPGAAQLCLVVEACAALWPTLGFPTGAPRVKFLRPIGPGAELTLRCERSGAARGVVFEISGALGRYTQGTLGFGEEGSR